MPFFAAAAGAAAAGLAAWAAGADPAPDPILLTKSDTLTPSKAFANRPGQYGSTS